jgi:hypothetical protein
MTAHAMEAYIRILCPRCACLFVVQRRPIEIGLRPAGNRHRLVHDTVKRVDAYPTSS